MGMNERPIEYAYVFDQIRDFAPETVLDVGTGRTALPAVIARSCDVRAIDNFAEDAKSNKHVTVLVHDITEAPSPVLFDMVTCVSVLEHIEEYDDAVRNMVASVKSGGYVVITCPFTADRFIDDVRGWWPGKTQRQLCRSYSMNNVIRWSSDNMATAIDMRFWRTWTGTKWADGIRVIPPVETQKTEEHQLCCFTLRREF